MSYAGGSPFRRPAPGLQRSTLTAATLSVLLLLSHCAHSDPQGTRRQLGHTLPKNGLWLDSLSPAFVQQAYGEAKAGRSVEGKRLILGDVAYKHGVGTHAAGSILIDLKGEVTRFTSDVGIDGERAASRTASVQFIASMDGRTVFKSPVLRGHDAPVHMDIDLTGAKRLKLEVTDAGDGNTDDHADYGNAILTMRQGATLKPAIVDPDAVEYAPPRLVIPVASPLPAIHGATIIGATPGRPFVYRIPATGRGPLTFSAIALPAGLSLDPRTGIITGALRKAGLTRTRLIARDQAGHRAARPFTIVGGQNKLALTPPMGWNSWNVWGVHVDEDDVRAAARTMIESGLAAHGYNDCNIDDSWEAPNRDAQGNILSNAKFPDMPGLTTYIHSLGLRAGIYSSPGPTTCGGYPASYRHEQQDARTYARWGFDFLKYDWCSYGDIVRSDSSLPALQKPYQIMHDALAQTNRDIVYSLCQYGMGDVWKWGASAGGQTWRTTGDLHDKWSELSQIYEAQNGHETYAGPGRWNDPDMLQVGIVGIGDVRPTRLTPNEQILHVSLWSMLAAPLLIGCDMTRLDRFTKAILTNDEVIDIDQDPLGRPAARVAVTSNGGEIWARPLTDGAFAVALVNPTAKAEMISVTWRQIGLTHSQKVRDLWLHKNIGSFAQGYSVLVPAHGVALLKLTMR